MLLMLQLLQLLSLPFAVRYLSFGVPSAQIRDTALYQVIVKDQESAEEITNWVSLHLNESCVLLPDLLALAATWSLFNPES